MQTIDEHLLRQMAFSRCTFGPGSRQSGVIDHIRKELDEIQESEGNPTEWIDVVILALDGLWRSLVFDYNLTHVEAKAAIANHYAIKLAVNETRIWPDWRTADPDKAIEHDRSHD